ncbi:MAG: hypothetical protein VW397_01200, partial [Candidatus Margulisiibacteriota bacterium]
IKTVTIIAFLLFVMGCSRQPMNINSYHDEPIYFSIENQGVYKYSGEIMKISSEQVNAIHSSHASDELFLSTPSSLNLLNSPGEILFRYENQQNVTAATLSSNSDLFYFSDFEGELYIYNRKLNQKKKVNLTEKIYPLPRQMVVNEHDNRIYYHDEFYIYEINLDTLEHRRLTKKIMPIASIAYNPNLGEVYFSTSSNGKIFGINLLDDYYYELHEPISVNGTLIAMNVAQNKLLFSKGNGKDTFLQTLDLNTSHVESIKTLINTKRIVNLSY